MKFNQALNNFSAGEWSPKMKGRTDVKEYMNACETLENFLPQIQGGAFRRPPTQYMSLGADFETDLQAASSFKMIPRILSDGTHQMMVAMNTLPSTTWFVFSTRADLGSGAVLAAVTSATYFHGGNKGADIVSTPADINHVQVGDVVFMVNNTQDKGVIPRIWYPSGTYGAMAMYREFVSGKSYLAVPYLAPNDKTISITPSATTGTITVTASAALFTANTSEGSFYKISDATTTGVVEITAVISTTSATAVVRATLPGTGAYGIAAGTFWQESAWSDKYGWPRTVTAHQGRLIFGGNYSFPDTIWGTRIGNIFDLMEIPFVQDSTFAGYTSDNSRPFTLTPNSREASNILALSSAKTLLIHTDRSEIVGYGTNGALGPNDVAFESSTSFGADTLMPTRTNNYAVFVEKSGRKLRDVIFNFDESQYKSNDLSFLADHLTYYNNAKDRFAEITGANQGTSYIYARTVNGRLLALAVDRDYQMNAWARITIGGSHLDASSVSQPYAKVMALTATPFSSTDRLFVIVKRRINGANKFAIEVMDVPSEVDAAPANADISLTEDCFQLDSKNAHVSFTTTTASGLTRFAGETVGVFIDGKYVGTKVVSAAGEFDVTGLIDAFTTVNIQVGFPYTSTLKTMPIEIGQQVPGSPLALFKRVNEVNIKFINTRGAKIGYKESDMISIGFNDPNAIASDPVEFFSGNKRLMFASNYDQEAQIIVKQDAPWPCNITAIVAKGQLHD